MEVMNALWDSSRALTVSEIVEHYAEPRPAYTTVATFLKILEAKGYVEHRRREVVGRTFCYSPTLSREKYITHVLDDVKDTLFGSSAKRLVSFFVQNEELSDDDLREIIEMIERS
jgi:predicted transcriptional regulator